MQNDFQDPPTPWPHPKSPWPSWHLGETVSIPDPEHKRQWHTPTSLLLKPGETKAYALRFTLASGGPRTRDAALLAAGRATFHAVPGYVLAPQMSDAKLLLELPAGLKLVSATSSSTSSLAVGPPTEIRPAATVEEHVYGSYTLSLPLKAINGGRARVDMIFSDGSTGTAHYLVLPQPSLSEQVHKYGQFMSGTAWLPSDFSDPFARKHRGN